MEKIRSYSKPLFIILALCSFFVTPSLALFAGIIFALTIGDPYPRLAKKASKYLLQISVVGLGFGMNLHQSLQAGKEGMIFTIVSVVGVMVIGFLIGKKMNIGRKNTHLISAGTAICGGSAIAAIAPVIKSDENETTLSLATIFILNAVALFVFPILGHMLGLTQHQFGTWAAIAIHDTSSVVGAGSAYGEEALLTATTIKLTRALWIIPLAFVSMLMFKQKSNKVSIPWFIFLFIAAMVLNTYIDIPSQITGGIVYLSRHFLSVTLFLIGSGLSLAVIKKVGLRPLIFGVILWFLISVVSLGVVMVA